MQTDLPLKLLVKLRAADLLSLFGIFNAEVVNVEVLELPASAKRLDTLLRLRDRQGREYLHLIEWQGYYDESILWRLMQYIAWLGLHMLERPIMATVVYLKPSDDVGGVLHQQTTDQSGWSFSVPSVRLWEHDAATALQTGSVGMAVLSPLMANATEATIEQAATQILRATPAAEQEELLTILGALASDVFDSRRLVAMLGRERLMASDFISMLVSEGVAEGVEKGLAQRLKELDEQAEIAKEQMRLTLEQQARAAEEQMRLTLEQQARAAEEQARAAEEQARAAEEQARAAEEQARAAEEHLQLILQRTVEDIVVVKFPLAPVTTLLPLRAIRSPNRLTQLHGEVLRAPDLATAVRLIAEAAHATPSSN